MNEIDYDAPPTVIVKRIEVSETGHAYWVVDCPFCGREHVHGAGAGHRVSDCVDRDNPGYVIACTEQSVRHMPKQDRVAYLRAEGWNRTESDGAQTWRSPDGRLFTLAAAVRVAAGALARRYGRPAPGRVSRRYSIRGVTSEMESADAATLGALDQAVKEWRQS